MINTIVDRGVALRGAPAALWRDQGRGDPLHHTQAAMYARDGIRVNGVAPGSIEFPGGVWDRRKTDAPDLYNACSELDPVRPAGPSGGSGECGAVPRLAARHLGDRTDDRGGWRADAVAPPARRSPVYLAIKACARQGAGLCQLLDADADPRRYILTPGL